MMTIGKIVSGSGALYEADLHEDGKDREPTQRVVVEQLQIDPQETIPPGTWTMVLQQGGKFYIQVPVYM